ncbi:hypothetical protein ABZ299_01690 [Streptomyces sp. NPDC006184]
MPVDEDGGARGTVIVLTLAQVELYYSQLGRLIDAREPAWERAR